MRRDGGEAPPPRPGTASCCQIKSAAASKSEREQTRKPRCVREAQEQTERGRWSALRQERLLGFFVGFLGCFFLSSVSSRVLLVAALRESILQPPPTGARCWREQRAASPSPKQRPPGKAWSFRHHSLEHRCALPQLSLAYLAERQELLQ